MNHHFHHHHHHAMHLNQMHQHAMQHAQNQAMNQALRAQQEAAHTIPIEQLPTPELMTPAGARNVVMYLAMLLQNKLKQWLNYSG